MIAEILEDIDEEELLEDGDVEHYYPACPMCILRSIPQGTVIMTVCGTISRVKDVPKVCSMCAEKVSNILPGTPVVCGVCGRYGYKGSGF